MADMDGTWQMNHDTPSQNHDGGQNILYMDGHVSWKQDNFCSNDPNDNIFIEDPWNADTDSYLIRMNSGLGKSFKGYPSLHYPRTEN
jgi:prepilin-type processing-associated H-X9-DG protein